MGPLVDCDDKGPKRQRPPLIENIDDFDDEASMALPLTSPALPEGVKVVAVSAVLAWGAFRDNSGQMGSLVG